MAKSPAKLVSVAEMVSVEQEANQSGYSYAMMMENAGSNLARLVDQEYKELCPGMVMGLVGSGNNGGDTLVALDYLARWGWETAAYIVRPRAAGDPLVKRAVEIGCAVYDGDQDSDMTQLQDLVSSSTIILDGILGTGIQLPIRGRVAEILASVKLLVSSQEPSPIVVAVDCPSGVDCDSGEAAADCIPADLTVTMAAYKQGLFKFPAHNYSGDVRLVGIGIPDTLASLQAILRFVVDENYVIESLPVRRSDAHKGSFGTLLVVAGSINYPGAALLAGQAAYRSGAGLVTLAVPQSLQAALVGQFPEATWVPLPDEGGGIAAPALEIIRDNSQRVTAMLIGPGFGLSPSTKAFMTNLVGQRNPRDDCPMVIDADGLKLMAACSGWSLKIPPGSVLTPHPGEMSILTGLSTQEIQANRIEIAEKFAREWGHTVVLKGAFTVIAAPGGETYLTPIASAALARAGSGDVLAGVIAGLLAQGMPGLYAAVCGAWIHGQAGLRAAGVLGSTASVLAGDLLQGLIDVMAEVSD